MSAIIKMYQKPADECARLAKASDDRKLREMFLKMVDQWTHAIRRGLVTQEVGFQTALTTAQEGSRWLECPALCQRSPLVRFSGFRLPTSRMDLRRDG